MSKPTKAQLAQRLAALSAENSALRAELEPQARPAAPVTLSRRMLMQCAKAAAIATRSVVKVGA